MDNVQIAPFINPHIDTFQHFPIPSPNPLPNSPQPNPAYHRVISVSRPLYSFACSPLWSTDGVVVQRTRPLCRCPPELILRLPILCPRPPPPPSRLPPRRRRYLFCFPNGGVSIRGKRRGLRRLPAEQRLHL